MEFFFISVRNLLSSLQITFFLSDDNPQLSQKTVEFNLLPLV
jgi:hypothetical protein